MQVNKTGLDLIKRFEGVRLKAYQDVAGIWTIGYGHIKNVIAGMTISAQKAEEFLKEDLEEVEHALSKLIKVDVNENEFSALASLVFNIGAGAFKNSTTLRLLNKDDRVPAADAIELWNKAKVNGKLTRVEGLAKRRAAEKGLFLTPTAELEALIAKAPKRVPQSKGEIEGAAPGEPGPSSRETPVESNRNTRDNLAGSRTIQGGVAALATGGVTGGPQIFAQIKDAVTATKDQVEATSAQIHAQADQVQAGISKSKVFLDKVQDTVPQLKGVVTNPTVVDATSWLMTHQNEVVGAIVMLSSLYIIYARVDDWFKGKR